MKQSDIALIIVIVVVSLTTSYFVGNAVFNGPNKRTAEVEVVRRINDIFPPVDPAIFNEKKAVNLTENIKIGDDNPDNAEPFDSTQ